MGRKRKPTSVIELSGGFKKNPSRQRGAEPESPGPLGSPPENFTPAEVESWQMLLERAPVGVLRAADWPSVVLGAKLFSEFMADSAAFNAAKLTRLHRILADFGMTPTGRGSLEIPKPKEENPFARLDIDYPI